MGRLVRHAAGCPRHRHLTRRAALRQAPALRKDALVGAIQYYDAQVDDARHTMTLVRTAAAYGAHVRQPGAGGRLPARGRAGDRRAGARPRARSRRSRSGPGRWSTRPACGPTRRRQMVGERGQFHVRASKGIHLVVPARPHPVHDRADPAHRDSPCCSSSRGAGTGSSGPPTPTGTSTRRTRPRRARDIDYLLDQVNAVLVTPLTREDVEGVYAGLRPLLSGESDSTSKLSREHDGRPPGARAGGGGRRQVHDVPGDGQGRGRRGRPRRWTAGCRRRAPTGSRWSAPRATPRCGTPGTGWPPGTGLHVARVEHLLQPVRRR